MFRSGRRLLRFFRDEQYWVKMSFFCGVSIFQGLSVRQLGRVLQILQQRRYDEGEALFLEGHVGKAVFVIESGKVQLTRQDSDGNSRVLGILGPGQIFGEMALLEDRERTASAVVVEPGTIHFLYTASLDALIHRHPDIGVIVLRNVAVLLSSLVRRTNKELDQQRSKSIEP